MIELINKVINNDWRNIVYKIEPQSIDLLLTAPPFGMNFQSGRRKEKWDKIKDDDNLDWLPNWALEISSKLKADAHAYVFCSAHNVEVFKSILSRHLSFKNMLIWEKNNNGMGDLEGDYAPQYEIILFFSNGKKKLNGRRDSNIIKAKKTGNVNHPTEKPLELLEYLIEKSTVKGDLVLATFGGSFSTARASYKLGRGFIVCEIEKKHCDRANILFQGAAKSLF